jgi:hypothetical protein
MQSKSQPYVCLHIYIREANVDHTSSVLVRLAVNVVFAFLGNTLALDTLLNLRDQAIHVLLVLANERDCVSGLTPSWVTIYQSAFGPFESHVDASLTFQP